LVARGVPGVAGLSSVGDEVEVKGQGAAFRDKRSEVFVCVRYGHPCGNDAESFENALDVRVDGEDVFPEGEEEDASGGLGSYAVEPEEFLLGVVGGKTAKVFETEVAVCGNRAEYLLNAAALGPG